ncbi:hypothetical protein MAPG_05099 [Magnaporthiopsis poae ATCC 64411]|uniref:Zn(2)-C6 fungal-type domain-containing protein n=1 Tax=Magnaporthiopsis poae (strain ATCC 64411 / 73-15) TaxID=644358 RepID=A0A0C4DYH7_MAGP6|nr:hypothetical protein MAPG_05099 [Magnaporthiopsis poae ATCC 64411]
MPRSRSTSSPSGVQRLPVNPRRHKVSPEQRKRVATACNSCNVKRVKCSGDKPCRQCEASSRECIYPVAVDKVSIPRSDLEELRSKCALLERCLQDLDPDHTRRRQFDFNTSPQRSLSVSYDNGAGSAGALGLSSPTASSTVGEAEESHSPPEDGRLLQDTDGTARYLGETSGATFLDNLKQFMSTIIPLAYNGSSVPEHGTGHKFLASVGRYQTADSRPLPALDVNPFWLPPPAELSQKLEELRYFIQDGGVSGGVYFWGDLRPKPDRPSQSTAPRLASAATEDLVAHRGMAFYHAALAYASLFGPATSSSKQEGEAFFACARKLLGNPLEVSTYSSSDIATIALMGLYMVEMNRRDAAYMYITTAMHISIMQGIHRGCSTHEVGKRIFWTVYILDRWISCLMGRPPSIMDDAIRLELPHDVPGLPSSAGLRAHIALAKISGHIVCNTYRIARHTWTDANPATREASHVDKAMEMLSDWLGNLPNDLRMSYETFSKDRSLCTLHMSHNQLLILTIRPIFLNAVKKAVADRFLTQSWPERGQAALSPQHQHPSDVSSPMSYARIVRPPFRTRSAGIEDSHPRIRLFRECSEAARRNLRLGRWLAQISPGSKLLLLDMHGVFNATIMLLLHQIAFVDLRPDDVTDIAFGLEAFGREAAAGDMYATDCLHVMQDLASLVSQLRAHMFTDVPHTPSPQFGPAVTVAGAASGVGVATSAAASTSPSPLLAATSLANMSRGLPGGGAPGLQAQPLPSPGMDGTQHTSPSTYLQAPVYNRGGDGVIYNGMPTIPVSAAMVGSSAPEIVYNPIAAATSAGLLEGGGDAVYSELMAWFQGDPMNDMYIPQFI